MSINRENTMSTRRVPQEVRNQVNAEIQRCIDVANDHYNMTFQFPEVVYKKRGTTAGTANDKSYTIDLNSVLLMENLDTFIDGRIGRGTVTHEFAHLVDGIVNEWTRNRGWGRKRSLHGPSWKRIMRLFGVRNPSRCHSYNVTNSRVKKGGRKSGTITIRCTCGCGKQGRMGAKRVAQWRADPSSYWFHKGFPLEVVSTLIAPRPAFADSKPAPKKSVKKGSKLEIAVTILRNFPECSRVELIELIRLDCNMSKAGATTYYYNAKKAS